uniref:Putative salivary secreted peptide n=1 Tax=Triatoma infestans TaxID=30076 RepID=A6YPJ4_TRIIF|nr:putative salivary secreted peptide [Triatoma infestans]
MQQLTTTLFSIFTVGIVIALIIPSPAWAANKCEGKSHNVTFGMRTPGDKLIHKERIKSIWKLLSFVQKDVTYPAKDKKRKYIITYIKITDRYTDGHGGCASIVKGGVGYDHVKIHTKSQFTRGLDFIIEIYGIKPA